jgi:hypothetical protein
MRFATKTETPLGHCDICQHCRKVLVWDRDELRPTACRACHKPLVATPEPLSEAEQMADALEAAAQVGRALAMLRLTLRDEYGDTGVLQPEDLR